MVLQRSMIWHFTEHAFTAPESSSDTGRSTVALYFVRVAWSCLAMFSCTVFLLRLMPEEVWSSAGTESTGLGATCLSPQRSVSLLCGFACSTTSVEFLLFLNAFVLISLRVECGVSIREEILLADLLQKWHPMIAPLWNLLQNDPFFQECLLMQTAWPGV